jgi:hypothetical protein
LASAFPLRARAFEARVPETHKLRRRVKIGAVRMEMSGLSASAPERSAHDRLDSWKEIASYLRKGERTVRRWERTEGLPVYRHTHQKQATVYAFRSELDVWLAKRGDHPDKQVECARALPVERGGGRHIPTTWRSPDFYLSWRKKLLVGLSAGALVAFLFLVRAGRSPGSTQPLRITSDTGVNIFPSISRDGRLVVYSSDRPRGGDLNLWLQPLAGAGDGPVQITRGPGDEITPDFSPDAESIVFRVNGEQPGIYVRSLTGSVERRLTDTGWRHASPRTESGLPLPAL